MMYKFERLIKEMDEIAGRTDEEVIMQIGETAYEPKNATYFKFASREEMDGLYEAARVVVCHAGVGSIFTALDHGKPVIAVPRRKKYGEHVDDHQLEIARELEKEGAIIAIYNISDLEKALHSIGANPVHIGSERMRLVNALRDYVRELEK
jgi:UDP-N-acetylglucosamine transferase subunit ALG13